jgi:hypothetical protein
MSFTPNNFPKGGIMKCIMKCGNRAIDADDADDADDGLWMC